MNDEMREMMIEEMEVGWCPIVNSYVDNDCFKHCDTCKDNIEFGECMDKEMDYERKDC